MRAGSAFDTVKFYYATQQTGKSVFCVVGAVLACIAKLIIAPSGKRQFAANEEDYNRVEATINNESNYLQKLQASPEIKHKAEYYGKYFPNGDMDEDAVAYVIDLIKTRRCDSFKEAIIMYDTHMYQQKQENIRVAMLEEQQKTTQAARSSARGGYRSSGGIYLRHQFFLQELISAVCLKHQAARRFLRAAFLRGKTTSFALRRAYAVFRAAARRFCFGNKMDLTGPAAA